LEQRAIQRIVVLEQRGVRDGRQRRDERALVPAELHGENGQRAADGEDVARDAGPYVGDLRRLESRRSVDRALLVVDPAHPAEIDELERVAGLDDVVGLEVAVQQTL